MSSPVPWRAMPGLDDLVMPLGPATEAPGGLRGAVLARWFAGIASGHVRPDDDAIRRCLDELDEHER